MNFKEWLLTEMPLRGLYPNWDKAKFDTTKNYVSAGSYYPSDKKTVESPVVVKKLSEWLKDIRPDFIILYYGQSLANPEQHDPYKYRTERMQKFSELTKIPVEELKKTINIQIMGSGGDPATPWIILHQCAHALNVRPQIEPAISKYLPHPEATPHPTLKGSFDPEPPERYLSNMSKMFTFRSARKNILGTIGELYNEIFVHFLANKGQIDIRRTLFSDSPETYMPNDRIIAMKKELEQACKNILNDSAGKIHIDME